ncbi:DNA-binding transcriptional MerR regulator [Pseudonocardia sediminis]|uniref:DNA-binding transcriptional MerR regulator n=1 Tax=Pseudonocardia sediminis TaxID=1397368 RepID=A0A4Q7V2W9_PSEST|nr:MerR family transcriptional regulator [Pseudonocardia sediminis]RZT87834.1 DNA-binding transcriptional MerR regulator [Pseudonocardia sediminis]
MERTEWKVGELARQTGLTVRTLHHWEERGLVVPSRRTAAGHRLYDDRDVRRVYEVVALRELGLSLEAVAEVLAPEGDRLEGILSAHLSQVEARLTALRDLRTTLAALVAGLRSARAPGTSDLMGLIDEVSKMTETFNNYFTDEQLAALEARREELGEDTIRATEQEWPGLIAAVQSEMDAGTDPASPRVRALATRWAELLEAFHGGDPGLREGLYRLRDENAEEVLSRGGPTDEQIDYIRRAGAAGV